MPEASGGIARALQNDGIVTHDTDGSGVEASFESMIAKLANRKEGAVCLAASGRVGKSSKAVWVEVMTDLLGSRTLMPEVVAVFSTHGLSVFKK